ncbi:MAG: hypothetical protein ACKOVA_10005 [Novosphingobium sp.]
MDKELPSQGDCCCGALADFAVVPMGGKGLDELVFSSFKETIKHDGDKWWLYVSTCLACRQEWMVAQDERIYDNFYLRRIGRDQLREILDFNWWPEEFLTYERVLALGKMTRRYWSFLDARSPALVTTAEDLRRERPEISIEEIANLLSIPAAQAGNLLN